MVSRLLKPYKGFTIEKSWEDAGHKVNVIYTAYTNNTGDVFNAAKTLDKLKKLIDDYTAQ